MANKELDINACKTFVCPDFNDIDINCKKLGLDDETINRCKDIGIEYLKKTYHTPKYTSIKFVIPAFIYIGANMYCKDGVKYLGSGNMCKKIGGREIATLYGITGSTVSKWITDVISVLEIKRIKSRAEMYDTKTAYNVTRVKCTHCGSEKVVRAGFSRGKQRYLCKKCDREFIPTERGVFCEKTLIG